MCKFNELLVNYLKGVRKFVFMPDTLTLDQRHRTMAAIHASSTKPEVTLRHALWQRGFRYRMNDRALPGKPDIVLHKYRAIIFIHGCFWHGHKGCKYYTIPKTNTEFWTAKVARNQERDQRVWRELEAAGWSVIIVWECELKKAMFHNTIVRVEQEIIAAGEKHKKLLEDRKKEHVRAQKEREARREKEASVITVKGID